MTTRSGIGFDVHPLVEGRPLFLGGIEIPYERGLAGHSDGDSLIHAVIDAILGAVAMGDIGTHFPSSDERLKGIASTELLFQTFGLVEQTDWRVTFVDATILAERPILSPYISDIRRSLAAALQLPEDGVNVQSDYDKQVGVRRTRRRYRSIGNSNRRITE